MTYNGYLNYAVWNVALWSNNDSGLYHEKLSLMDRYASGELSRADLRKALRRPYLGKVVRMSDVKGLSSRERDAVVASWLEEADEHKLYVLSKQGDS